MGVQTSLYHHFAWWSDFQPPRWCPSAEKLSDRWWHSFSLHTIPLSFFMISFYLGGLRLKTWDHAQSRPRLPLIKLLCSCFCWTLASCEPFTLGNTHWQNPKLSAAPLPHTHDLNVTGEEKWAAGSWGQGRDCDIKCNQTFYQSSSTSEVPSLLGNHRSGVGRGHNGP